MILLFPMSAHPVFFHVDLDAFFASVEQRDNPDFRNKPVIIGLVGPRNVVSTCSYEARKYGVHSAMPTTVAYNLCPNGIFIPGNMRLYSKVSHQVMTILKEYSDQVHQVSIDEAWMDMTGTQRLFGKPKDLALSIKKRVKDEIGITMSIGIAASPFIAKMASDYNKPDGICMVSPGKEEMFIDAIGLKKIWGIGKSSLATLEKKGFKNTQDIRKEPLEKMKLIFGNSMGSFIFNAVRGIDPGIHNNEPKSHSISTETTFYQDVEDSFTLNQVLLSMSTELIERSFSENIMAKTVGLKLRWGDFRTITVQNSPSDPILNADQIFKLAQKLLFSKWKEGQGLRLIGLGLYQTYSGDAPLQDSLFSENEHRKRLVEKTAQQLKAKGLNLKKASELQKTSLCRELPPKQNQ